MISGSADSSLAIYKCYTNAEKRSLSFGRRENRNGLWKCVGKLLMPTGTILSTHHLRKPAGRIANYNWCRQFINISNGSSSDQLLFSRRYIRCNNTRRVNCVCWHPLDSSTLASAGDDGTVRLWNYRTCSKCHPYSSFVNITKP
jgi:WD40 repeat protein